MTPLGTKQNYILQLNKIEDQHFNLVGEEGLRMAAIHSLGVEMPETWILTSVAFDDFLTAGNLVEPLMRLLEKVVPKDIETNEIIASEIRELFEQTSYPSIVIKPMITAYEDMANGRTAFIRVTPAWVMGEEIIPFNMSDFAQNDIVGSEQVALAVKHAWSSVFSARALTDRANTQYSGPLSAAVIIQKQSQVEIAGNVDTYDIERGDNNIVVQAVYGLERGLESAADKYRVEPESYRILEKLLNSQQSMLLLKTKVQTDALPVISIPLSETWRGKQKLDDRIVAEIAEIAAALSTELKTELRLHYTFSTGKLQITYFELLNIPAPQPVYSPEISERNIIKQESSSNPVDLDDLAAEVSELAENITSVSEPIVDIDKESGLPQIKYQDKFNLLIDRPQSSQNAIESLEDNSAVVTAAETSELADLKIPQLMTSVGISISDDEQTPWNQIKNFPLVSIDFDDLLKQINVDFQLLNVDSEEYQQAVTTLAEQLQIISNQSQGELTLRFSNLSAADYHSQGNAVGLTHAQRFVAQPQLLTAEYLALKEAKRLGQISKVTLILPGAYEVTDMTNMKVTLTHSGFRRSNLQQLGIDFSFPGGEFLLDELSKQDIDVAYLNLVEWSSFYLGERGISERGQKAIARKLQQLVPKIRKLGLKLVIDLSSYWELAPLVYQFRPDQLIGSTIPSEATLDVLARMDLQISDNPKPVKRGRRPKEI